MTLNPSQRRDVFHVVQIALATAMSVFLLAIYTRPIQPPPSNERVREIRTQQTVYVVDVKYVGHSDKPPL